MRINLSPQFHDAPAISAHVLGDVITVNGVEFDFGPLQDGGTLPLEAIDGAVFVAPVERVGGVLIVTLLFPHSFGASDAARFPVPIDIEFGNVEFPK